MEIKNVNMGSRLVVSMEKLKLALLQKKQLPYLSFYNSSWLYMEVVRCNHAVYYSLPRFLLNDL